MKNAMRCPKCEHDEIWKIDPLCFPERDFSNIVTTIPVAARMIDNENAGLLSRPTVRKAVGRFVVYVCASCGFSEMYAADIDELARLMKGEEGSRVERLRATAD